MSHHHQAPVNITSARQSRSADIRRREIKYLISMGVRTVCFIMAVIASGWLRWTLVAAALVLPYIAVVIANASNTKDSTDRLGVTNEDRAQIESDNDERENPGS